LVKYILRTQTPTPTFNTEDKVHKGAEEQKVPNTMNEWKKKLQQGELDLKDSEECTNENEANILNREKKSTGAKMDTEKGKMRTLAASKIESGCRRLSSQDVFDQIEKVRNLCRNNHNKGYCKTTEEKMNFDRRRRSSILSDYNLTSNRRKSSSAYPLPDFSLRGKDPYLVQKWM